MMYAEKIKNEIREEVDSILMNSETIKKMIEVMESEMKLGLSKNPDDRKKSSLQMENTYVMDLIAGTESGDVLALDLGGTNFRVLHLKMLEGKCVHYISRNYNVPSETLCGPAVGVFDHLAESISKFLDEENLKDKKLPLGFTFSFPMIQKGLREGVLVTWTKSFKCPDGVGEDAVKLLDEAIKRRGDFDVDIVAILNDTTGTLMAGSYLDHECYIGLILGTGSNASYVEHIGNIDKWIDDEHTQNRHQSKRIPNQVLIDTEWGAMGDNGCMDFIKTDFDWEVDKLSNHVGSFTFEKLFGGMYMGEVVRQFMVKFVNRGVAFGGKASEKLLTPWSLTTTHVSNMEKDEENLSNTKAVIEDLGLADNANEHDICLLRYISEVVSIRGAQIISTALSVLLHHIGKPKVTIAVDGSLYNYHPKLKGMMAEWLAKLVPETKSKLILAEDGSGRGAGFVAAVACRLDKK